MSKGCVMKILPKAHFPKAMSTLTNSTPLVQSKAGFNMHSWSNFSLVSSGKGREKHVTTLTNPSYNFNKSMWQLREFHVISFCQIRVKT